MEKNTSNEGPIGIKEEGKGDLYINIFEGVESAPTDIFHKFELDYVSFKLETNPKKFFKKWKGKKWIGSAPMVNLYYILW